MKKLYTAILCAALTAPAFSAFAADLPQATVVSGLFGKYITKNDVWTVELQYNVGGEVQNVSFVDPKTYVDPDYSDFNYEYAEATITTPDAGDKTVQITLTTLSDDNDGPGPRSAKSRADEEYNTMVVQLGNIDNYSYEFITGDYSVAIPAGIVKAANGDLNPQQTVNFTVLEETAYVWDSMIYPAPADPSEGIPGMYSQDELKTVTISFAENITKNAGSITYTLQTGDINTTKELADNLVTTDSNKLLIDLSSLEQGKYTIEIPTGYLLVGANALNASNSWTYTVWNGMMPAEMLLGPDPIGMYVNNIQLYYGTNISKVGNFPALNVYDGDPAWSEVAFTIPARNISILELNVSDGSDTPSTEMGGGTGNTNKIQVLYINIYELFMGKTGEFCIVIPAGIVKDSEGKLNPQQEISFTLTTIYPGEMTIENIDPEGNITIEWEGMNWCSPEYTVEAFLVTPDRERVLVEEYNGNYNANYDMTSITVSLGDLVDAEGPYELVIPEGKFSISGVIDDEYVDGINQPIIYPFTYKDGVFAGVKSVKGETPESTVKGIYNLQGVKVADDLNGTTRLPAGIYIINGKKVYLR